MVVTERERLHERLPLCTVPVQAVASDFQRKHLNFSTWLRHLMFPFGNFWVVSNLAKTRCRHKRTDTAPPRIILAHTNKRPSSNVIHSSICVLSAQFALWLRGCRSCCNLTQYLIYAAGFIKHATLSTDSFQRAGHKNSLCKLHMLCVSCSTFHIWKLGPVTLNMHKT